MSTPIVPAPASGAVPSRAQLHQVAPQGHGGHGGHHDEAAPLGGPLLTRAFWVMAAIGAVGAALMLYRFVFGLSTITNLTDTWPWGIWKPMNVVTATGIGAGGYGTALLCYVLNRGKYHPLVRPALLVSALAYTVAGASVLVDLGRWWSILKVPAYVWRWNGDSVLLEVALCVLTYVLVLWTELSPAFLEKLEANPTPTRVQRFSAWAAPKLDRAMPFIIAMGVLLPTMHQSSLGSLFLLSSILHPLWHTGFLPALFLITCLMMGYSGVVVQDSVTRRLLRQRQDRDLLPVLSQVAAGLVAAFFVVRFGDLAWQGRLGYLFNADRFAAFFWLEMVLAGAGGAVLATQGGRTDPGKRMGAAVALLLSGALYRFDTYLIGLQVRVPEVYFPSVGEILASLGLFAMAGCVFLVLVRRFPILVGPARAGSPSHS